MSGILQNSSLLAFFWFFFFHSKGGITGLGQEEQIGDVSFSSHHIKGTVNMIYHCSCWSIHLITWTNSFILALNNSPGLVDLLPWSLVVLWCGLWSPLLYLLSLDNLGLIVTQANYFQLALLWNQHVVTENWV